MRRLIKTLSFDETARPRITLGAGTRLNPITNRIELKPLVNGKFDTNPAGFTAQSWIVHPEAAKQWLAFQAFEFHPSDPDVDVSTPIRYRVGDGTTQYHWDGAAWTPSTTLWNTEAEINANLATFPIAQQRIVLYANLATDNPKYTPALSAAKFLYRTDVVFQEDLIYRSVVRSLKEAIRPVADWPITAAEDGTEIDLDDFKLDTPYNLADVIGAYATNGATGDVNLLANLLSSYNPTTKVVTLSAPVVAGDPIWLQFAYQPEVTVHTSRDYLEVGKVPAIVLSDINIIATHEASANDWIVTDKAAGTAVVVPGPKQHDFEFVARFLTDKARDLQRLQEAVRAWIRSNPQLRARGIDELYCIQMAGHFDSQGVGEVNEVHAGRIRFRVLKALFYDRPDEDTFVAVRFTMSGPPNVVVS